MIRTFIWISYTDSWHFCGKIDWFMIQMKVYSCKSSKRLHDPPSDNTFLYINYHHHRWNILNSRMTSYTLKTFSKECWLYLPLEFHAWFKIPISDQYFGILYNTQLLLHTKLINVTIELTKLLSNKKFIVRTSLR